MAAMLDRQFSRHADMGVEATVIYRNAQHPESDGGVLITRGEQERLTPALMGWLAESETTDTLEAVLDLVKRRGLSAALAAGIAEALNKPLRQRVEDWQRNVEPNLVYRKRGKAHAKLELRVGLVKRNRD